MTRAMSAPPPSVAASLSTSGYQDGLGRRSLAFDRECGSVLERLVVRPELVAFERALRQRADRLATFDDERIARVRDIVQDRDAGTLTVVSEFVAGRRLSDLMDEATDRVREDDAAPSVDEALGLLLQLLPALGALHARASVIHGLVGAERTVITPAGQIVLLDSIYGPSIERLQLSRRRLWAEFRLAAPPSAGQCRFDVQADIAQAALAAAAMTAGRPLTDRDYPDGLRALLDEAVEIAQLRGSARFATALQRFFERALPLPARHAYADADEASAAVQELVAAEMGIERCRTALAGLVRDTPLPAVEIPLDVRLEAAPEVVPEIAPAALPVSLEPERVEIGPVTVVPAPDAALVAARPPVEQTLVEHIAAAPVEIEQPSEPAIGVAPIVGEAPPVVEPIAAATVEDLGLAPIDVVDAPPVAAAPPALKPAPRTRNRASRRHRDRLRSADVMPGPPRPAHVDPPPPMAVLLPPAPAPRMPSYEQVAQPLWVPSPPAVALAPIAAPAAVASAEPSLRVRAEPPAGYAPPISPRARAGPFNDISAHHAALVRPASRSGSTLRWKLVAAAALAIAAGVTAGRANLLDRLPGAVRPVAVKTEPVAAPILPTGSIVVETQPAGARVLIDGEAAGETPLKVDTVATGPHIITLITSTTTLKRSVKVEAGKTSTIDVAVYSGWLAVFAPVVLELAENGRTLGSTEHGRVMLPPGRHTITLANKDLGYTAVRKVDIEAGEERVLTVEPRGTISVNAVPWAEVYIDGRRAGDTPLANFEVLLGTREMLFKHPQFGERRLTVVVTASAPAAISVDFSK